MMKMERILWIVVLATIVWAVCMAVEAAKFDKSRSTGLIGRFDSPIAMLELAGSQTAFAAVLDEGQRHRNVRIMQINTYMDFVFILFYCDALVLLGVFCSSHPTLRYAIAATVIITGGLDIWEDLRLLRLLQALKSAASTEVPLPRPVSLGKWGFFGLDLVLVAIAILQATSKSGPSLLLVMGIFVSLAAACTFVGLCRNSFINLSVLFLLPALVLATWIWRP
jgi:hypothetical protein